MKRFQEGAKENMKTAEELVEEFKAGKRFYYTSPEDYWQAVTDLAVAKDDDAELLVKTAQTGPNRRYVPLSSFLRLQESAAKEGAAEFVQKTQEQVEQLKTIDKKDTSPEGRRKVFDVMYLPKALEIAMQDLTGESSRIDFDILMSYFRDAAQDPKNEEVQIRFPGWKSADFIEMTKWMEEGVEKARHDLAEQMKAEGVDPEQTLELIKRTKEAKKKMEIAAKKVRNMNGFVTSSNRWS